MRKYRILGNGYAWRVEKRVWFFFWKKITEAPTLTEAIDFLKEYDFARPRWKVVEYYVPEQSAPMEDQQ
jgi:hypothetical protein